MKPSILFASVLLSTNVACSKVETKNDSAPEESLTSEQQAKQEETANTQQAFQNSGVITPTPEEKVIALDAGLIQSLSDKAAAAPGSRAPYDAFHNDVSALLPTSLALAPVPECVTVGVDGGDISSECKETEKVTEDPKPEQCPEKVCATACASAEATAYAAAFAHASARACAFATAWACVWSSVPPFGRVCAWSQSEACASAFASAFAFGFAHDSDQECKTVCSDGTTTTTKGPAAAAP